MNLFATEEKPAGDADALSKQVKRWLNAPIPLGRAIHLTIGFHPPSEK